MFSSLFLYPLTVELTIIYIHKYIYSCWKETDIPWNCVSQLILVGVHMNMQKQQRRESVLTGAEEVLGFIIMDATHLTTVSYDVSGPARADRSYASVLRVRAIGRADGKTNKWAGWKLSRVISVVDAERQTPFVPAAGASMVAD